MRLLVGGRAGLSGKMHRHDLFVPLSFHFAPDVSSDAPTTSVLYAFSAKQFAHINGETTVDD